MFPWADEAAFIENIDRLMDQAGKIDRILGLERRLPVFHQRRHQLHPFTEQVAYRFRRPGNHLRLGAAVHAHQAHPAVKPAGHPPLHLFVLPEVPLRQLPAHLFFQPQAPTFRLRFFLLALLLPAFQQQCVAGRSIAFQLTDSGHFFAALLNNMQRQRMESTRGNII